MVKFIVVLLVAAAAYHLWNRYDDGRALRTANVSANGFMELPAPSNLDTDTIIVLAAMNCPKEAAQRADQLADELKRRKLPTTRAKSIHFEGLTDGADVKRLNTVLNGELPIVFVNGRAKNNPTLDEVLAEYGRS